MSRSADLDVRIRSLRDEDRPGLVDFACGDTPDDTDLADFVRDDAFRLQELRVLCTYLATLAGGGVVGYIALMTDAVVLSQKERRKIRAANGPRLRGNDHPVVPAMKVARLAVSQDCQRQGVGERLLRFALVTALEVAELTGCRLLTLDALPGRVEYYTRRGFVLNLDGEYAARQRPSMRYDIFHPTPPQWAAR